MSHLSNTGARRSNRLAPSTDISNPTNPTHQPRTSPSPRPPPNDNDNDNQPLDPPPPPDLLSPLQFTDDNDDNDLSYHSTQASDKSTTPFYPTNLSTSIPNPTTSNPTTTTNHQLQSLLLQLASRIDHIEVTNNNRIESLESQILQSQSTFQRQLLQSQSSLAQIIQSSLQPPTTTTIPTHPSVNPSPPTPITHTTNQSNHNNSSTSTDPPASYPPTTSQPSQSSITNHSSPDPPESPHPHFRAPIQNPYRTPSRRSLPTPPPPDAPPTPTSNDELYNSTPSPSPPPPPKPPFPIPTSHQTSQQPPPTYIVQAPSQVPKLMIDSFKPKNGYLLFKHMALLSISADPYYSDAVIKNSTGNLILNENMSDTFSKSLFIATLKALGSNASDVVSTTSHGSANALELWKTLDNHYLRTTSSHVLKNKLKKEYEQIKKESNESFSSYVSKFEINLHQLRHNGIDPGSSSDIAYRYLESLDLPNIFNTILMNMDEDSSWALGHDLRLLSYKAEDHFQKYQQIYCLNPTPSPPPAPNPRPANPRPTNPHPRPRAPTPQPCYPPTPSYPTPAPSNPTPPPDNPRPPPQFPRNESEIQRIRAILQEPRDHTSTIHRLHQQHPHTCPLHSNCPHPIISCAILRNICNQTNNFQTLNNARNDYDLPPMPQTGLLQLPPRPRASPPPPGLPSRPPSNPYLAPSPPVARRVTDNVQQENPSLYVPGPTPAPSSDPHDFSCPLMSHPPTDDSDNIDRDNHSNSLPSLYSTSNSSLSQCSPCHHCPSNAQSPIPSNVCEKALVTCRYSPLSSDSQPYDSFTSTTSSLVRAVCDSGASNTMTSHLHLFHTITYFNDPSTRPHAMMGDDCTTLPIHGYGFIDFTVHSKRIRQFAYFVPKLGTTLLSIKQHMAIQGCYFHAEANAAVLAFPSFQIHPRVHDEIDMLLSPSTTSSAPIDFDAALVPPPQLFQSTSNTSNLPSTHTVSLVPQHVSKYVSQASYQSPFVTKAHFIKQLPSSLLPRRHSKRNHFHAYPSSHTTIAPGQTMSISTGCRVQLPPNMHLKWKLPPSLLQDSLQALTPTISPSPSDSLTFTIHNNSAIPVTIASSSPIAYFTFHLNDVAYVPAAPPSVAFQVPSSLPPPPDQSPSSSFRTTPTHLIITKPTETKRYNIRHAARQSPSPRLIPLHPDSGTDPALIHNTTLIPTTNSFSMSHSPIDPQKHISPSSSLPPSRPTSPTDSVNAAISKAVTMTHQSLRQSIGYLKTDKLLKNMALLSSIPIHLEKDSNPRIDPGEVATMKSARRNTTPSQPPLQYSDVWHLDIGYGPCSSIGGFRYTLLVVDKRTRYKLVYGLKNLTSSLLSAIQQFVVDCSVPPKLLRTDFDYKLIGGPVKSFLQSKNIPIESSPPYRQHQNGLVESHWQTVVSMARNWLTSSLLPSKYWFFAIKRACEVSNLLPTSHLSSISTPFELAHKKKVDYRLLFPMFSVAYIKYRRANGTVKDKWSTHTLKCIFVGSCRQSDGLLFFHPPSKQLITGGDGYKFDSFSPAGPQFEQKFDGNFTFSTGNIQQAIHRPPSHELSSSVFYFDPSSPSTVLRGTILSQPLDEDDEKYTVQSTASGDITELTAADILDHDPTAIPTPLSTSTPFPHLPWLAHNTKVTLFLNDRMQTSKQGFIKHNNGQWHFLFGHLINSTTAQTLDLPNFHELAESMVHNKKLFNGWKTKAFVLNARRSRATSNVLSHLIHCRKVSAANLHAMHAPTLLSHSRLHPDDKVTWDAAYLSEYNGLVNINTWETITEEQYQSMRHLYQGILPTMAISTIKYDGDGKPNRAKCRIVALGNLDPHSWTKQDCFAPVLSQLELRFLTALAVRKKCIPKTGDVTQAFCQSCLPDDEHYICRPPPGCPITPPNTYWRLKKTLYGLKRSPRHFYELARKLLLGLGLQQHPTSPCIFFGTLIEGHPPLYLGLYVDDFIYFSESSAVEKQFEKDFGTAITTDFNGQIGYFLGINFSCTRHGDGHVTIHLGQEAFIENLCQIANLDGPHVNPVTTPYRSGCPVDTIPRQPNPPQSLTHQMQVLLGCLTWLSISTRPDIATITNLLAQFTNKATVSHLSQVKRVIKYLKSTKTLGISFHSNNNKSLESHVKFPIPEGITALCDANWGPQDQSKPKPNESRQVDLFKSRSISGFLIYFGGPIHWVSKRQTITARSSAEAEIYATDECTKCLLHIHQIVDGLLLEKEIMPLPTTVYNDNAACVQWSKNMTTKGHTMN